MIWRGPWIYPKPLKVVLTAHLYNLAVRKEFGLHHGFKVFMGAHYMGGFIGDD